MRIQWVLAAAVLMASPTAFAQFYAYDNSSVRTDAVPGEYFFSVGVEAVRHNDYTHAVAMYKVASSWGYKPAEFNVGVIFAKGEGGVPIDLPQAYAWMQLAAERKDLRYVIARNRVQDLLTPQQLAESEKMLAGMRDIYADEVALPRAKAKWREVLTHATCSQVGYTGCDMKVGNGGESRGNPAQFGKPKVVKGFTGGAANVDAMDVAGGDTVEGSIAYSDLRATDNPYDPRFNGVVTVGNLKPADKETGRDKIQPQASPANP
jgi:hypothetical protein